MKFKTYLHNNLKIECSTGIIEFKNGVYETNNKDEIDELKKVSFVFVDEATEIKKEFETIINPIKDDEVKKAGRPKKTN